MNSKIKVLLVEDSGLMRILIKDLLTRTGGIEVIATAKDGKEGVEKALSLRPHVVITDMVMPDYDGLYVTRELMSKSPLPIILLSSLKKSDSRIFDALELGAFDFISKPSRSDLDSAEGYDSLVNLVTKATSYNVVNQTSSRIQGRNSNDHTFSQVNYDAILIGSSTGGPRAVEDVVKNLPSNLPIPVIIAQHMPESFITQFAERLGRTNIALKVRVPKHGELARAGYVYIAPGSSNLRLSRKGLARVEFEYTDEKFTEFNNPSVDCLFSSGAEVFGSRCIGVVLTGMGRDGTDGIRKIKGNGGYTIAQDENSSVVFGMPKSAIESNCVDTVLPLQEVPGFLITSLS